MRSEPRSQRVSIDGNEVAPSPKGFELLALLARGPAVIARREAAGLAVIAGEALANPAGHDLASLAARFRLVSGSEVAIVDSAGRSLVALDSDESGGTTREMAPGLTTALRGQAVTVRLADEDGPQMAAILPVRDGDKLLGAVGVTVPAAATDRHVHRVWLTLGALALALLAVASTIG